MKKGILIIPACLLALSCVFDSNTTTPNLPEATTPANCLKCVEVSFNGRNVALLEGVLSANFVFHFHQYDVGRYPPGRNDYKIPETWSRAELAAAARNMFYAARSITLAIATAKVGDPGEEENTYRADNIGISFLVIVNDTVGYVADKGHCNFELERYDGPGGKKLWRLNDWWDNTGYSYDAQTAVIPGSLGRILAMYH